MHTIIAVNPATLMSGLTRHLPPAAFTLSPSSSGDRNIQYTDSTSSRDVCSAAVIPPGEGCACRNCGHRSAPRRHSRAGDLIHLSPRFRWCTLVSPIAGYPSRSPWPRRLVDACASDLYYSVVTASDIETTAGFPPKSSTPGAPDFPSSATAVSVCVPEGGEQGRQSSMH